MEAGGGIGTWMRFCFRNNEMLLCGDVMVQSSSWGLMAMGVAYLFRQVHCHTPYGRYMPGSADPVRTVPAKLAWFLQELPSFLVPMLLILTSHEPPGLGQTLLSWTFCVHYFQSARLILGESMPHCASFVASYCYTVILTGIGVAYAQIINKRVARYGRYVTQHDTKRLMPAKVAWLLQELPSFLLPVLLWLHSGQGDRIGRVFLGLYCGHYFQRTFIYSLLTNGRPTPLRIVIFAAIFCSLNGLFQGYYMLYCAKYSESWLSDIRLVTGLTLFFLGMAINIHSDYILRHLRQPGEVVYRIPKGGMFEYVSGANFFGEIVEWFGYAIATWSMPSLSFAIFTMCSIGPRAYHHHRFYLEKFTDYPRSRKAVIPFIF